MITKLVHVNVVLVAQQFNPSIITQLWLVKNDILLEQDFAEDCIFTPMFCHIRSREFNLLVLPEQIQFSPIKKTETEQELIMSKVGMIIQKLPHTPYSAIGLNFNWHVKTEEMGINEFTRAIFYRDIPLYREFNTEDARFGGYLSKNIFGCRLRLDIKPVQSKSKENIEECLQFSFNYHRDLDNNNKIEIILDLLNKWNEAKEFSAKIVENLEG